ncbi:uncharacterized protein ACB058_020565 isoform 1-T1 [Synchiropus picturatus]
MEELDFIELHDLEDFFHNHKTDLSRVERPDLLLKKMRDRRLIRMDKYQEVSGIQEEAEKKEAIYQLLDQFAEENPQSIKLLWKCLFKDPELAQCPTLRNLLSELRSEYLPRSEDTSTPGKEEKKKEKTKHLAGASHAEQPSWSSSSAQRGQTSSPMEKADKQTRPTFPLSLTCGSLRGKLHKNYFKEGQRCIRAQGRWFTPIEFEEAAGMEKRKNWKTSIRCSHGTLASLIKAGHLPHTRFPRRHQRS